MVTAPLYLANFHQCETTPEEKNKLIDESVFQFAYQAMLQ